MRCYLSPEVKCELNYTLFGVYKGICPNLRKMLNQVHWLIDLNYWQILKFWRLSFVSNKVLCMQACRPPLSSYNWFGYWGHFHILEKLDASLGRVFSGNWGGWLGELWLWDQSPPGIRCRQPAPHSQLSVKNWQPKYAVISIG